MRLRGALIGALIALVVPAAPASGATGVDGTCSLALSRLDPTTTNVLALDTNAVYWLAGYAAVPGTRIHIEGQFAHARYTGFNVYDAAGRPVDAIADEQLQPNPGSSNPFLPGADRNAANRDYSVYVEFGPRPPDPAPNTVYTGDSPGGTVWYRVYIPDQGRDAKGGVPLPRLTYESGLALPGLDACRELQAPYLQGVNELIANAPGLPETSDDGSGYPGRNPPDWRLFRNLGQAASEILLNNETGGSFYEGAQQFQNDGPGFFANRDIAYVFAPTSRGFGEVLVVRGRAPSFTDTRAGPAVMPAGQQLRYWSFCQYEPAIQRVIDCRSDDRIAVEADGTYEVVVTTAEQRPSCAANWIAWGPTTQGLLIYRHMLPDPGFANAIQNVAEPGLEQEGMGEYYPAAEYLRDRAAYETAHC